MSRRNHGCLSRRGAIRAALVFCGLFVVQATLAQEAVTAPVVITASRLPDAAAAAPLQVKVLTSADLSRAPQTRLDDILRAELPGFSLFRRSSSRTANPTTQGVTLRNFGPNGAGRTLVLLDGIPLNDPFAGYVLWNQVPPASLDSVLVVPGGGAGLFGNAAIGGTIFLVSREQNADAVDLLATLGTHDVALSAEGSIGTERTRFSTFVERFSSSGYPVLAAGQRGPVDTNATSDSWLVDLGLRASITERTSLQIRTRRFSENRGNGTVLTNNATDGADFSATLVSTFPDFGSALELSGYVQQRRYRSTFSSVNASRTIETPALDQFHVPADAFGASAVWSLVPAPSQRITLGADLRDVRGATNEAFAWNGSEFARIRRAGGAQRFYGIFLEDVWQASKGLTVVGALRLDRWELRDGFRIETLRRSRAILRSEKFADRAGETLNARLGIAAQPNGQWLLRVAGYSGFRVPTLNELYRPFRVGNDITEANPALEPERLLGVEGGIDWRPQSEIEISATGFLNRLENAVGNITIGTGPGTFDIGGFVPAGGVLRQRRNLDLIIAPGFEISVGWKPAPRVQFRAAYLFTDPTIAAADDPTLEGRLLPQTARHVATTGAEWTPIDRLRLTAQSRWSGRQFEDDRNTRVLAAAFTIDVSIAYEISPSTSAALKVENLLDSEIETGKSAGGLTSIGAPRSITAQLHCLF